MRAHGSLSFESQLSVPGNCNVDDLPDKQQASNSGGQSSNLHRRCQMKGSSSTYQDRSPSPSLHQSRRKESLSTMSRSLVKIDNESQQPKSSVDISPDTEDEASVKVNQSSELMNEIGETAASADGCVHASHTNLKNVEFCIMKDRILPPLYTLRRNPKPSKRFVDQEYYALDVVGSTTASKKSFVTSIEKARHACSECGKEFSSWKGLFGHMRCHPEREWRGIQPPIANKTSQEDKTIATVKPADSWKMKLPAISNTHDQRKQSESEFDASIAQTLSETESETDSIEAAYIKGKTECNPQSWKTRKRSKRSRSMSRSLQAVNDEAADHEVGRRNRHITPTDIKEERNMANSLVMLACAGKLSHGELARVKKKRIASYQSIDLERNSACDSSPEDGNYFKSWGNSEHEKINLRQKIKSKRMILKEAITVREENNEDVQPDENDQESDIVKYECTRCRKTFKSHQALGGHRASHKNIKGCYARAYTATRAPGSFEDDLTDEDLPRSVEDEHVRELTYNEKEKESLDMACNDSKKMDQIRQNKSNADHECSICHRTFTSGQALGGHKRCHWGGAIPSDPTGKQQELPFHQALFQSRNTREELDLNLPASLAC
ncbi:hypothetical protein O6H91_16G025700 [Diphasiastrum complanatum]|nr:hypothetical protein O6H91_16G025700 [Diphasiastrum complanatum]